VSRPERPVPPPFEGDDRLITAVITAGFLVALVVLLIVRDQLPAADRWWIWVAAFGTALGIFGLAYVPHLKRSRERTAARQRAAQVTSAHQGAGYHSVGYHSVGYHSATDIVAPDVPAPDIPAPDIPAPDISAGDTAQGPHG
jgi:hypothetical protein